MTEQTLDVVRVVATIPTRPEAAGDRARRPGRAGARHPAGRRGAWPTTSSSRRPRPGTFVTIEAWRHPADLEAHTASPHMAAAFALLRRPADRRGGDPPAEPAGLTPVVRARGRGRPRPAPRARRPGARCGRCCSSAATSSPGGASSRRPRSVSPRPSMGTSRAGLPGPSAVREDGSASPSIGHGTRRCTVSCASSTCQVARLS